MKSHLFIRSNITKNDYLIQIILLVIIWLLLVIISVSCYYYYARHRIKKKYILSYLIQSKNGIMVSVGVNVENQMIDVLIMMIICGILIRIIVSIKCHVKLTNN